MCICDLSPRRYYDRIFPANLMARWLSYGSQHDSNPATQLLHRREFSFTTGDDVYIRYLSYEDANALRKDLVNKLPHKIDIGAVFSAAPRDTRSSSSSSRCSVSSSSISILPITTSSTWMSSASKRATAAGHSWLSRCACSPRHSAKISASSSCCGSTPVVAVFTAGCATRAHVSCPTTCAPPLRTSSDRSSMPPRAGYRSRCELRDRAQPQTYARTCCDEPALPSLISPLGRFLLP